MFNLGPSYNKSSFHFQDVSVSKMIGGSDTINAL